MTLSPASSACLHAVAALPGWVIWLHPASAHAAELICAYPADNAIIWPKTSRCMGHVFAPDVQAALAEWQRLERTPRLCVIEAHMRSGESSEHADFALVQFEPEFLRLAQSLASTMHETLAKGSAPVRSLSSSFPDERAQVRWDNPELDACGVWELVVAPGEEAVLIYNSDAVDVATTGVALTDLQRAALQGQERLVQAFARDDSYESLAQSVQRALNGGELGEHREALASALASAEEKTMAFESSLGERARAVPGEAVC